MENFLPIQINISFRGEIFFPELQLGKKNTNLLSTLALFPVIQVDPVYVFKPLCVQIQRHILKKFNP